MKKLAVLVVALMMVAVVPVVMGDGIPSNATIKNLPPEIICKCEGPDDRDDLPGTQITPKPSNPDSSEQLKTVTICIVVCDPNGKGDISSVVAEVFYPDTTLKTTVTLSTADSCPCPLYKPEITRTPTPCTYDPDLCQLYKGTFQMSSTDPAGEYRVHAIATDSADNKDTMQNRFFYESLVYIHLDFTSVDFGDIEICVPKYVTPGTIHNLGNDLAKITISATNMVNNGNKIEAKDLDATIEGENYWDLSGVGQTYSTLFAQCVQHDVEFSIHAQVGTPAGAYAGTITIEGKEAGPRTILFENKDSSDIYQYDPILNDAMKGDMTYDIETFDYMFNGHGLQIDTEYCLIYYTEPFATQGNGMLLKSGTTDGSGDIILAGTLPQLPVYGGAGDYEYDLAGGKYAKIWLVPCADYDQANHKLIGWNPSMILFEIETIMT